MSGIELILPTAFQAAGDINSPQKNDFVVGTVTAHVKIHTDAFSFDLANIELDEPLGDIHSVRAILRLKKDHDPIGRRLRGRLLNQNEMAVPPERDSDVVNTEKIYYDFMKMDGFTFFDEDTLHIAVDDPQVQVAGDALRVCWDLGLYGSGGKDGDEYYTAHRMNVGQDPDGPLFRQGGVIDQELGPKL